MDNKLMLPTGIEDFKEIRTDGYYYVDKTALIEQVLDKRSKVTLFTRPRRFGKTLNMSMLRYFFETGTDSKLFNGLYISQNAELCEKYMGKYPVIAISLKGVDADSYTKAKAQIIKIINREARRHRFLLKSENLDSFDKELESFGVRSASCTQLVGPDPSLVSYAEEIFGEPFDRDAIITEELRN